MTATRSTLATLAILLGIQAVCPADARADAASFAGRWKLHLNPVPVLYDLEADVGERNDVIRGNREVVAELRTAVIAFQEEMRRNTRPAGEIEPK